MIATGGSAVRHRTTLAAALALTLATVIPANASRQIAGWSTDRYSTSGPTLAPAGDFDGDGYDDFLVGFPYNQFQPGQGRVELKLGRPQGEDFGTVVFLGNAGFGITVAGVGDLDNDGFPDIAVGSNTDGIKVFRGGAPPDTTPDLLIPQGPGGFGSIIASAGDFNDDGYADFMVGAPLEANQRGRVYVYFGGAVLDASPDLVMEGTRDGDQFGISLAGGKDLNGDGFDDIVVGAPYYDIPAPIVCSGCPGDITDCGLLQVYYGGAGADTARDFFMLTRRDYDNLGRSVALLADFNGDGAADLAAGAPGRAVVFVYYGGVPQWDPTSDWTAASTLGRQFGVSIAAGDDVNRDHLSDLLVSSLDGPLVYFGGRPPDALPDAPLSIPLTLFGASRIVSAGDVNGDGYHDWLFGYHLGGIATGSSAGLFTAHGDLQLTDPNRGDLTLLGGAPYTVRWAGAELSHLDYTRDGSSWQTLASGVGGSATNEHTVTIPVGPANHTARMRVRAVTDTIIDSGNTFSVEDSVQAMCLGTTAMGSGAGVTWSAHWLGFPEATRLYRLFREDAGGTEQPVGPDTLREEGFYDPTATPTTSYRLAALRPDGAVMTLGEVAVGASSCDNIHLESPNGGESLFQANFLNVLWTGTRPVDIQLSRDDGATWQTVATNVPPPSTTIIGSPPNTSQARLRAMIHGVGGAVWDDSDGPFTIRTDIQLQQFTATPLTGGGMRVAWQTNPAASIETFIGFRLCRDDTLPGAPAIGPWPNPGNGYDDPAGTSSSVYRLWAVLFDYTERALGTIGALPDSTPDPDPNPNPPVVVFGPTPVASNAEITLRMPSPPTANGPASDVEVRAYDIRGREVALLGRGLGAGGTVTLRWTPASFGMRPGLYWIRTRSVSAGFVQSRRMVVL